MDRTVAERVAGMRLSGTGRRCRQGVEPQGPAMQARGRRKFGDLKPED
jgi:hypothetical protein